MLGARRPVSPPRRGPGDSPATGSLPGSPGEESRALSTRLQRSCHLQSRQGQSRPQAGSVRRSPSTKTLCNALSPNGAIWVMRSLLVKVKDAPKEGGARCGMPPCTTWGKDRAPGHRSMAKVSHTSKEVHGRRGSRAWERLPKKKKPSSWQEGAWQAAGCVLHRAPRKPVWFSNEGYICFAKPQTTPPKSV